MKIIAIHILASFLYYQTHTTDLEKGLKLGGAVGHIHSSSQLDIIVSNYNEKFDANDDGCEDFTREVKSLVIYDKSLISPQINPEITLLIFGIRKRNTLYLSISLNLCLLIYMKNLK